MRSTKNELEFLKSSNMLDGEKAAELAHRLVSLIMYSRGVHLDAAIHIAAEEAGISYWVVQRMWKRHCKAQPKSVLRSTLEGLAHVYARECARQMRALQQDLKNMEELRRVTNRDHDVASGGQGRDLADADRGAHSDLATNGDPIRTLGGLGGGACG